MFNFKRESESRRTPRRHPERRIQMMRKIIITNFLELSKNIFHLVFFADTLCVSRQKGGTGPELDHMILYAFLGDDSPPPLPDSDRQAGKTRLLLPVRIHIYVRPRIPAYLSTSTYLPTYLLRESRVYGCTFIPARDGRTPNVGWRAPSRSLGSLSLFFSFRAWKSNVRRPFSAH